MNLFKNCTAKLYSFLVIDTTLASDNPLSVRSNLLERILKLVMAVNDKIIDEKLQCDINREASKLSALSSGKIDKHEHLTSEDILPVDENPIKKQDNLTYSLLGKSFKKQKKRHLKTKNNLKP